MQAADRLHNVQEYYFSHKLREVNRLIEQGKPIINLGIGSPDLQPPDAVIKSISQSILEGKNSYQAYKGIPEFRQAIADFYRNHFKVNLNIKTEILPLMGAKEGIMHVSMAFLNPGDKVLLPNPGYATYTSVTKLLGAIPEHYTLTEENNWYPNLKQLEKTDLSKVKIMWLNYPHMPTGAKASSTLFKRLIAFAYKHDILLVNDNPYSFILNDNPLSILSVNGSKGVALELNSLSKSFNMAGWRIGMLLGSESHLEAVHKIKSNMDSGMFYALQRGAITALQENKDWFQNLTDTYEKRRKIVWKIVEKLGYSYQKNTAGMFVWAKIPKEQKSEDITDYLLKEKHIFVTPGSIFGSNGEGYMRFSLCQPENNLLEVLKRLS